MWSMYSTFSSLNTRLLPRIALLLLFFTLVLAYTLTFELQTTFADDGGTSFSVQPSHYDATNIATRSYFILDGKPDTTVQNGLHIKNTGAATGTVTLYAVDATTGQNSGLVYNAQDIPSHDVGSWIHLAQHQLTLTPGQSEDVSFQVSIPKGARPGQHIGGIVAKSVAQASTQKSTFHVDVQSLSIVAVQLDVAGPQADRLEMTGVQASGANGYQNLLINLRNTGTTLLKPQGTLRVLDAQGNVLQNFAIKLDTFLPDTAISYPVYMKNHPLEAGTYTLDLQLMYGQQHTLRTRQALTVTQQQISQVFKSQGPLHMTSGFSGWQGALVGLLLVLVMGCVLFVSYTFCRKAIVRLAKKR